MGEKVVRRLYLADKRGGHRYLRVTWHRDTSTLVLSHWDGDICMASTPISLDDASRLAGLVNGAMRDLDSGSSAPAVAETAG